MHSLLKRQLKRYLGRETDLPPEWNDFVHAVDAAYQASDLDRASLERSLELSSQELLDANSEMRAVFQAIPDWLFRIDDAGTILSFKASVGDAMDSREIAGKKIHEVIPLGKHATQWDDVIRRAREQRSVTSMEYAIGQRSEARYYEARLVPLPDNQLVAIIRNITDRHRAETMRVGQNRVLEMIASGAPLKQILTTLSLLVESQCPGLTCSILLVDAEGERLHAGASPSLPEEYVRAIDGVAVGEGVGSCGTAAFRKQRVIVSDIERDPLWEKFAHLALKHGLRACWSTPVLSNRACVLGTFAVYYRQPRRPIDAEIRLIEMAAHVAGIAIERQRAEEALRQAEAKFRNIVENSVEGIFQCTPEGRVIDANPAFVRMLGYRTAIEMRLAVSDFRVQHFVEPGQHAEFLRHLSSEGVVQRFEVQLRRLDTREVWLSLNARLVRTPANEIAYYEAFAQDITERKRLEEQFRQSQKMEAFGQLAGGVAHDFNNLLTVIQMSASMLRDPSLDAQERATMLADTIRAADRATNLTRQLLTFSRRQQMQLQELDLNEVVAGMTKMFQRLIGEHIRLETHHAPGGAFVRADAGMMEQVLMNLAVNARDAMPKGGRLIFETSLLTVDETFVARQPRARAGEFVRLNVTDTGTGIPAEHLPKIFEPFFTTKGVGCGTGLGLATVFGIVEQHKGWIEVASTMGRGTCFSLFIPRTEVGASGPSINGQHTVLGRGSETILVTEDEADVRALMKKMLERHGYNVIVASSGVSAMEVWKEHGTEIDLLITDMVMPEGVSGRELAERLVARKPDLKVLFCSGYTDEMLGPDSPLRKGVNFIDKPFDVDVLLSRVRDVLDAEEN